MSQNNVASGTRKWISFEVNAWAQTSAALAVQSIVCSKYVCKGCSSTKNVSVLPDKSKKKEFKCLLNCTI